jgi:hypothetical protein
MNDMSTSDKINICRRAEISKNMTAQAPCKTDQALKQVNGEFLLPNGTSLYAHRTRLYSLRIQHLKTGLVIKQKELVNFFGLKN